MDPALELVAAGPAGTPLQVPSVCWLFAGWSRSAVFELRMSSSAEFDLRGVSASRGLDALEQRGWSPLAGGQPTRAARLKICAKFAQLRFGSDVLPIPAQPPVLRMRECRLLDQPRLLISASSLHARSKPTPRCRSGRSGDSHESHLVPRRPWLSPRFRIAPPRAIYPTRRSRRPDWDRSRQLSVGKRWATDFLLSRNPHPSLKYRQGERWT